MSAGPSLPSRAFFASSPISWLIWKMPFLSASLITGTISPFGVSAAKPMWKYCLSTSCSPSSEALNSGNFFSAATAALIMKASIVTLTPDFSFSLLVWTRKASSSVMSASSWLVTCGITTQLRCRLAPLIFLMRLRSLRSTGPNLREVDLRPGQQAREGAAAAAPGRLGLLRRGLRAAGHHALDEALHVFLRDAALGPAAADLGQRHAEFAREAAHRRRGMRQLARRRGRRGRRQPAAGAAAAGAGGGRGRRLRVPVPLRPARPARPRRRVLSSTSDQRALRRPCRRP